MSRLPCTNRLAILTIHQIRSPIGTRNTASQHLPYDERYVWDLGWRPFRPWFLTRGTQPVGLGQGISHLRRFPGAFIVGKAASTVSGTPAGAHNAGRESPVACADRLISSAPPAQITVSPDSSGETASRVVSGAFLILRVREEGQGSKRGHFVIIKFLSCHRPKIAERHPGTVWLGAALMGRFVFRLGSAARRPRRWSDSSQASGVFIS